MAKTVDEGETRVLGILFGSTPVDATLYLGLYTDATEPGETDGLADITELEGDGYARVVLTRGSWVVEDDEASYAQQAFTAGAVWGEGVYGYFIATTVDDTGKLLFVEHFADGPYTISNIGDRILVTPKVSFV